MDQPSGSRRMGRKMGTDKYNPSGIELRKGIKTESIRIKFMYRGMECRETLKLAHTKANIKFAERLRGEILNAIQLRTFDYAKYFPDSRQLHKFGQEPGRNKKTVGNMLELQMELYERTLAPSTFKNYQRYTKSLLMPKWGTMLLTELKPAALRSWIATLELKARSLRQILIPLRGAIELALNDELIDDNPLDRVKLKKIMSREAYKVDAEADPFSASEILTLLETYPGQVRNVFQFAFYTGMRPGEIIALRWDSIDWLAMQVKVERSRTAGVSREELKTKSSRRLVDLRQGAYDALIAQRQHSELAGDLVFLDPATGKGWDTTGRLSIYWATMIRRSKMRYRKPYQTRHTFASTLLSAGENPLYVAKQMGHKDTTMLTRHYSRWIEQENGELPREYQKAVAAQQQRAG